MLRILVAALAVAVRLSAAEPAETIVHGGPIYTGDEKQPVAEAFAVRGDRLVFVGSLKEAQNLAGPNTVQLDLKGRCALPGFIDAHCHPRAIYPEESRWAVVEAGPDYCKTMDDLIAALKRKAKVTPKGQWIKGLGYQETKLGRHPTVADLDMASTDHPIIISHSSGHLSVCNSLALKAARVTKETPDPSGGAFDRDEKGELTGLLKERAAGIVRSAGPDSETPPEEEVLAGYKRCFRNFFRNGITGVHVAGTEPKSARRMILAHKDGAPLRFYFMLSSSHIGDAADLKKGTAADEMNFRYGAIKLFHGNSLSGQTSWLSEPYSNNPEYFGLQPARKQEDLNQLVAKVHNAGLQACIHSNGDREIEMVLDAFEAALKDNPRADHRHRIEHCSVVNAKILARIKTLGLVIAPHSYVYEHGDKMENYGKDRWDWMHPNRSLIDQGTIVAGNSDYPISAAIPLLRIHDMVNRTSAEGKVYGAKQCCTIEQSIRVFTHGSAYGEFGEKHKGVLRVGMLADFVVLSEDPTKARANKLKDITVERTVIGGRTVFEKAASAK